MYLKNKNKNFWVLHLSPLKMSFVLETYHHQFSTRKFRVTQTHIATHVTQSTNSAQNHVDAHHQIYTQSHAHTGHTGQRSQNYCSETTSVTPRPRGKGTSPSWMLEQEHPQGFLNFLTLINLFIGDSNGNSYQSRTQTWAG